MLQISHNSVLGMTPAVPTRIQTCSAPFSLHIQPLILKSTDLLSAINSLILAHASSLSTSLIPADLFAIFDITDNFDSSFDMFAWLVTSVRCHVSTICLVLTERQSSCPHTAIPDESSFSRRSETCLWQKVCWELFTVSNCWVSELG